MDWSSGWRTRGATASVVEATRRIRILRVTGLVVLIRQES